jgi:hypothetical protein
MLLSCGCAWQSCCCIGRKRFSLLVKILLFSDPWLKKAAEVLPSGLNKALATLAVVALDGAPENGLQNLWNQLKVWRRVLEFLRFLSFV